MALTGHLSDLSLSELIEFFCNQRKSGRLKVLYPRGAGYFICRLANSLTHASVCFVDRRCLLCLTLPNAEFEFSVDAETSERTINQPWTQVVLEGLRRLDENISPSVAFPPDYVAEPDELEAAVNEEQNNSEPHRSFTPGFLRFGTSETHVNRKPLFIGAVAIAVVGSVAAIGVPAGWYHKTPAAQTEVVTQQAPTQVSTQPEAVTQPQPAPSESTQTEDASALAAKRQRDRDKKFRDARAAETAAALGTTPAPNGKRVVVTVTYDETGRVTQASGGDANALRIARQKRFPPGKGGSATVAIPIN